MASVRRVAASNGPKKPGDEGRATPKPITPCNRSAASGASGRSKARKHSANDAAFTSHRTSDQPTTSAKRPGCFRTASPATTPPARWVSRSAKAGGSTRCASLLPRDSHRAGRCATASAATSTPANNAAAPVATLASDVPPSIAWPGNDGAAAGGGRRKGERRRGPGRHKKERMGVADVAQDAARVHVVQRPVEQRRRDEEPRHPRPRGPGGPLRDQGGRGGRGGRARRRGQRGRRLRRRGRGARSEERRVGKECRARWSPYH